MRDDRSSGDTTGPAVWFAYSPDRKGEHPKQHLKNFNGALQADAYVGFHHLYEGGAIHEASCWAHARRKFHEIHVAHPSPITSEAIERIAALYAIEKQIRGSWLLLQPFATPDALALSLPAFQSARFSSAVIQRYP